MDYMHLLEQARLGDHSAIWPLADVLLDMQNLQAEKVRALCQPLTVQQIAVAVYKLRAARLVNPEGNFDKRGRWYPSAREDAGDVVGRVRGASAAWPYSYMLACRSRRHCLVLVRALLAGEDVPPDVSEEKARITLVTSLFGPPGA